MFESLFAVPLHFTVEFIGLLVLAGAALLIPSRASLIPGSPSNRWTASAGFGVLAAAQVVHGGSFVQAHSGMPLVALTTIGFALILVGIVGGLGSPSVGASFAIREPTLLAPAAAAFIVALMALLSSLKDGPRSHRRISVAAFLLGLATLLSSVAPEATIEVGAIDPYVYWSHGVRLLGYVALGSWLYTAVRSSIRTRFVASFVSLLIVVVLALSTALTGVISNSVEEAELERAGLRMRNALAQVQVEGQELSKRARAYASAFSEDEDNFADARGSTLALYPEEILDDSVGDFAVVVREAPGGSPFYASREAGPGVKTKSGPKPTELTNKLVQAVLQTTLVQKVRGPLTQRARAVQRVTSTVAVHLAAEEVQDPRGGNKPVGLVVIGKWMDAFVAEGLTNVVEPAKVSLVMGDRLIATELPGKVSAAQLVPNDIRPDLDQGFKLSRRQTLGKDSYFSAFDTVGTQSIAVMTVVVSTPADEVVATRQSVVRVLFLVAMGVGAIALVLAYLSGKRITRPIQELTRTATAVREGNLSAQAPVRGDDEVGQLGETFNEMTASLGRMTTDLRKAARDEHDLRSRIETIIQSMADGLVAVDAEAKVLAWNREAENLTGIKARRAIGRPVASLLDTRNGKDEAVPLPIFDLAEGSLSGVFLARKSDSIPIAVTSAVLRDEEGLVSGAVAVLRDMTREREIERMKGEFLSNISHELRTPLTPIKGYAEILSRKDIPAEKGQQFARGILESTARLERIVELLVDFSALEAGRLTPRTAPVDLGSVVEKLSKDWVSRAPQHSVVAEVKARLPKVVGDERLLKRSLEEVLDNAIKFSPHGGTIKLEAKSSMMGNGTGKQKAVTICVSDEGIGISPEDMKKIFSDFHQLDGSETRAFGGLGLGLAFVQRIVAVHDGDVAVDSKLDKGTRFSITIPAVTRAKKVKN